MGDMYFDRLNHSIDEMVDKMLLHQFISTPRIGRAFRCVDRRIFFPDEYKGLGYNFTQFRRGQLRIAEPRTYVLVLEFLDIKPGMSFLNLGSGSGYLNTLAGLLIGKSGVNHGVEQDAGVVNTARENVKEFLKSRSNGVDVFEFCEPKFFVGDIRKLLYSHPYDRIYVSDTVLRIPAFNGILRSPGVIVRIANNGLLIKGFKVSNCFENIEYFNFGDMIPNRSIESTSDMVVNLPARSLDTLSHLCRDVIRSNLRKNIEKKDLSLLSPVVREDTDHSQKSAGRKYDVFHYSPPESYLGRMYRIRMEESIKQLSLPKSLKKYLNYDREYYTPEDSE